jgi:hypothetical protein
VNTCLVTAVRLRLGDRDEWWGQSLTTKAGAKLRHTGVSQPETCIVSGGRWVYSRLTPSRCSKTGPCPTSVQVSAGAGLEDLSVISDLPMETLVSFRC